jgi:hypothetical protein
MVTKKASDKVRVSSEQEIPVRSLVELRGIIRRDDTVPIRDKVDRF